MACTFSRPYLDDSGTGHGPQLHQLDWQRNRLLLGHNQSGFNPNERTHLGDGDFHSQLITAPDKS